MPRDEVDGIKTKRGKVVYDRESRAFSFSDFARISKKLRFASSGEFDDCETFELKIFFVLDALERIFDAALGSGCAGEVQHAVDQIALIGQRYNNVENVSFSGGSGGGAGASGDF